MQVSDLDVLHLPSDTLTIVLLIGVAFFLFLDLFRRKML